MELCSVLHTDFIFRCCNVSFTLLNGISILRRDTIETQHNRNPALNISPARGFLNLVVREVGYKPSRTQGCGVTQNL